MSMGVEAATDQIVNTLVLRFGEGMREQLRADVSAFAEAMIDAAEARMKGLTAQPTKATNESMLTELTRKLGERLVVELREHPHGMTWEESAWDMCPWAKPAMRALIERGVVRLDEHGRHWLVQDAAAQVSPR